MVMTAAITMGFGFAVLMYVGHLWHEVQDAQKENHNDA